MYSPSTLAPCCQDVNSPQIDLCACMCSAASAVSNSVTPWTVARQVSRSMGFSRQEDWSGLPFPPPGESSNTGIDPHLLHWQAESLPLSYQGTPN